MSNNIKTQFFIHSTCYGVSVYCVLVHNFASHRPLRFSIYLVVVWWCWWWWCALCCCIARITFDFARRQNVNIPCHPSAYTSLNYMLTQPIYINDTFHLNINYWCHLNSTEMLVFRFEKYCRSYLLIPFSFLSLSLLVLCFWCYLPLFRYYYKS